MTTNCLLSPVLQVKAFRPTVTKLFEPLAAALLPEGHPCPPLSWPPAATGCGRAAGAAVSGSMAEKDGEEEEEGGGQQSEVLDGLQEAVLRVYEAPDKYAGRRRGCGGQVLVAGFGRGFTSCD